MHRATWYFINANRTAGTTHRVETDPPERVERLRGEGWLQVTRREFKRWWHRNRPQVKIARK